MTDPTYGEAKLAIAASSGVGKTALVRYLQGDPRLSRWLVADVDSYRRSSPPELNSETPALRAMLEKRVDVLFGVMIDPGIRALLEENGWSLIVLSLPEDLHRHRLVKKRETGAGAAMSIDESIAVQRSLERLGFPMIDAAGSVEAVASDIVRAVDAGKPGRRFAILGSWGVGKTTLTRYLRTEARAGRKWQSRLIVDSAWFMPNGGTDDDVDGPKPALHDDVGDWSRAEDGAVRAALRKTVDVVGATLSTRKRRALLEERGFQFVVLSLPEPLHRERLARRQSETGRVVDVDSAVKRQRKLESLGFEAIDAGRPLREIADDVVEKMIRMQARAEGRRRPAAGA